MRETHPADYFEDLLRFHSLAICTRSRSAIFMYNTRNGESYVSDLHEYLKKRVLPIRSDGPIFSLKLGSQNMIVLTSGEMIKKVVDKKSGNFSDRPKLYMQSVWEGSRIIMRGYDSLWKVERKMYHQFLNITKAGRYHPYQDLETKQLLCDLLEKPAEWENLITRTTLSMSTSMAYGFRVLDTKSEVMQELFRNTHGFFVMVNSSKLLDWYPQLRPLVRLLPGWIYPTGKKATQVYHRERAQFRELYENATVAARKDDSLPSKPRRYCGLELFG